MKKLIIVIMLVIGSQANAQEACTEFRYPLYLPGTFESQWNCESLNRNSVLATIFQSPTLPGPVALTTCKNYFNEVNDKYRLGCKSKACEKFYRKSKKKDYSYIEGMASDCNTNIEDPRSGERWYCEKVNFQISQLIYYWWDAKPRSWDALQTCYSLCQLYDTEGCNCKTNCRAEQKKANKKKYTKG